MTDGPADKTIPPTGAARPSTFSVVIPVRPTESPSRAIESLKKVGYPAELFEVIVIPGRRPSRQRNLGVRAARGEIIYFLDNDSQATPALFETALACFDDERVAGAGGPNVAVPPSCLVEAISERVLTSPLGTAKIQARYKPVGKKRTATERDLILCNLAIRKRVLEEVGGIDEKLYPNEENELISRIVSEPYSYRFVYSPDLVVLRKRPSSLYGYFRTIFGYGRGRVQQTLTRPKLNSLQHFLPLLFLLYVISVPFLGSVWAWLPLGLYGLAVLAASVGFAVREKRPVALPLGVLMLAGTHAAYALGMLWGFLSAPWRERLLPQDEYKVKHVKTFDGWIDDN